MAPTCMESPALQVCGLQVCMVGQEAGGSLLHNSDQLYRCTEDMDIVERGARRQSKPCNPPLEYVLWDSKDKVIVFRIGNYMYYISQCWGKCLCLKGLSKTAELVITKSNFQLHFSL